MRLEPYLCFGGEEIGNAIRTLSYLRDGFGGSEFEVPTIGDTAAVSSGYVDPYTDTYVGDVPADSQLVGYCSAYDEGPYRSPLQDDAPWYESTIPASAEFLGCCLEPRLDPVSARALQARGPVGSSIGALHLRHRILNVTGSIYAASARGMEYGERWLADVLSGAWCTDPDPDLVDALLLPACPGTGDNADASFRTLRNVACIDGPHFTPVIGKECAVQALDFQLAAESPYLWHPPTTILDTTVTGAAQSVIASTDSWLGDATLKVTITPVTALSGWRITGLPLRADQVSCPSNPWTQGPCFDYQLGPMTTDDVLILDGVRGEVVIFDQTTKQNVDGLERLTYTGIPHLPDIGPCSRVCVSVFPGTGSAQVTVEQHAREL